MSQRTNDMNRYRDFPKSYEDFQKIRVPPVNSTNRPSSRAQPAYTQEKSPRTQEIPIPITTRQKPQSNENNSYRDQPPLPRKPTQKVRIEENNNKAISPRSAASLSPARSQERVRDTTTQPSPSRTRPQFRHEESFEDFTHESRRGATPDRSNFSSRNSSPDAMSHSEWLHKKNQEKKQRRVNPNQTRINKEHEFGWKSTNMQDSMPPSEFTISHINQHHDMLRLEDLKVAPEMNLSSTEWLSNYSIDFLQLTLKDLLAKGVVSKPVSDKTGKAVQHLTFESVYIDEFEYKLNLALEMYSKRIKWLMQSSKKIFGLIQGERTALIIDSSEASMAFGRAVEMQEALVDLISEQLAKKKQMYLLNYDTDTHELCEDGELRNVHHRSIEEAKLYVANLKPGNGSNLLKAFKKVATISDIDSIVVVIGSVPDQNMDILVDYMSQVLVNKKCSFHCVSFEFSNHIVNTSLKNLAEDTDGRYHCYSNSQEELIYNSTDVSILLKEIQKTQELLNRIKGMKQGILGSAIVQIANELSNDHDNTQSSSYLPRPRGHELPLNIERHTAIERTSTEWINQHGLKSKKLNLYQVLAPNAYNAKQYYIPVLNKTVTSQVHSRAMVQFDWHDGSVKNLHVDLAELYDYQKKLRSVVELFEKRVDWLSTGSRKIFGSIAEDSVVILIDCAAVNSNYLIHIQHSLRLLLEQQMSKRKCFNLIAFGRNIKRWRPTVVKPTDILLQDAWKWILGLKCSGTHNVLGAVRAALENEEERKHGIWIDGLYLFTSGMPDQSIETICSYMEELACGRDLRLHTILFNVDDYDKNGPIAGRWANITNTAEALRSLAHSTINGRFHWFRETGIIESDDIRLIQQEIERTVEFSIKASTLVENVKRKTSSKSYSSDSDCDQAEERKSTKPCPLPRQTKSSLQRMELKKKEQDTVNTSIYSRPGSAKSTAKTEAFYVGGSGNTKGSVFRQYPTKKSVRKFVPSSVVIPDREEQLNSKAWLKKYALAKLKLDLHKLVSGPECKHNAVTIGTLKKDITARYCSAFPSININGTVRHLQLKKDELKLYSVQCEKVLKRYLKRLQWLLSGSRRLFGTITEYRCCILIDTSGSMINFMPELRSELANLVWEQFYKNKIWFNLIRFSDRCEQWRETIIEPTEENCHMAIAWLATLTAHGNTCTLEALEMAFNDESISSMYLLTDGKPDSSVSKVMEEVKAMNSDRGLLINTVSLNCEDVGANDFLKCLAGENSGRYHRSSQNDREIQLFVHKILMEGVQDSFMEHIPSFEGDDLRSLAAEITKARQFLKQSVHFSTLYDKEENFIDDMIVGPIHDDDVNLPDQVIIA